MRAKFFIREGGDETYQVWAAAEEGEGEQTATYITLLESKGQAVGVARALRRLWNKRDKHTSPGWISVEDELPEDYQDVLVREEPSGRDYEFGWYASDGGWYTKPPGVTHWQPLPEPPEQECDIGLPLPPQCVTDAMDKFARDVAKAARKRLEEQFINPLLDDLEQECHKTKTVVVSWDDNTTEITIRKVK